MYLVYIDESTSTETNRTYISAIVIHENDWTDAIERISDIRSRFAADHKVLLRKEVHATDWLAGRGRVGREIVPKYLRVQLFRQLLAEVGSNEGISIFNAVCDKKNIGECYEWMMNRIQKFCLSKTDESPSTERAIIFCDQGMESIYPKIYRRMRVFNPIPSAFGSWGLEGSKSRNLPISLVIEDPIFLKSEKSHFIQIADWCAYALLRNEEPLGRLEQYNFSGFLSLISPRFVVRAFGADPRGLGIIRCRI